MSDKSSVVIDKILAEARKMANSTLDEGNYKAEETINVAKTSAMTYFQKKMLDINQECEEIVKRKVTLGNLEAKKLVLAAKQAIISDVFEKALDRIINLEDKEYLALIEKMLCHAKNNDSIAISERDKSRITSSFIDSYAKKNDITLSLCQTFEPIKGGVIIKSIKSDKNLSLNVLLKSLRDETEPNINKILFGAK